ncbi:MAG: FAD-dependent oxidoreductase [Methylococcales bacterium]|nr:FAD-dependent oxidoreductase [Methylococcales bacterium]
MKQSQKILLGVIVVMVGALLVSDVGQWLSLEVLQQQMARLEAYRQAHVWVVMVGYFLLYVLVTALSVPGAAVLTLAGGALFGLGVGVLLVSFASTLGATLAFLVARFLLRDWVAMRFAKRMASIDAGMRRDGALYLFTLRLVPVLPFFLINLAMGLTGIKTWTFYWVSQLGMLAGTLVYVNAGTQLAKLDSVAGILSPELLLSFALLAAFPWLAKTGVAMFKHKQIYRGFTKPKRFDRNLIVIGAGSGGLVTAYIAAAVKAKVTLVEKHAMGGDCLNTGCVPSKTLIRSARWAALARRGEEFGFQPVAAQAEFSRVMRRVREAVARIEPHDSVQRYTQLGVEVLQGEAKVVSPWAVEVHTEYGVQRLTARALVVATGARPLVPDLPGLAALQPLTSDTIWQLETLPKRLLVLGGGPIGCELAQSFQRLGSEVTLVEMAPRLLIREDEDVSDAVKQRFITEGMTVKTGYRATSFVVENGEKVMLAEAENGTTLRVVFDQVLMALGRVASVEGFGLETLGVALTTRKTIATDPYQATNFPNIYAVGDVAGPYQFTHTAAHQAWYAAVNALFGSGLKKFRTDYSVIPWATFTDPEVARVGLNEAEAKQQQIAYEVTRYNLDDLDRAIADGEAHGWVKVLTVPGKDKILGVTLVGEHAGELIAEFVLAMKHGLGLNKLLSTIHIYPTWNEANKYAAGAWKRAHAPARLLAFLARFHDWRR